MTLRENPSTPPFSRSTFPFYFLSTEIFEPPPLSVNFGKLQPPLYKRGGPSYESSQKQRKYCARHALYFTIILVKFAKF